MLTQTGNGGLPYGSQTLGLGAESKSSGKYGTFINQMYLMKPFLHQELLQIALNITSLKPQTSSNAEVPASLEGWNLGRNLERNQAPRGVQFSSVCKGRGSIC
jgi:hypothetical protein